APLPRAGTEPEPPSFEVQVPQAIVAEPAGSAPGAVPHELVGDALALAIGELHAAGVRAGLRFMPFAETQPQIIRHTLPWLVLDREQGSPGIEAALDLGREIAEGGAVPARVQ